MDDNIKQKFDTEVPSEIRGMISGSALVAYGMAWNSAKGVKYHARLLLTLSGKFVVEEFYSEEGFSRRSFSWKKFGFEERSREAFCGFAHQIVDGDLEAAYTLLCSTWVSGQQVIPESWTNTGRGGRWKDHSYSDPQDFTTVVENTAEVLDQRKKVRDAGLLV